MESLTQKRKLDYKWVILILCFLMEFVCLGFCSSNPGLYTDAVTSALNIDRSLYQLGMSIRYIVQVVTALSFGSLVHRFGIRKMACVGLGSLVGSVFIRSAATQLVHIYISSALWGLGIVFSGGTMAGAVVRRWFHKDLGKYTGLVMSANGIGGAIAAQIITPMIESGTNGYRNAYLLSGIVALVISVIVVTFLRESPDGGPVLPKGDHKKKPKGDVWVGIPYADVKKTGYFYASVVLFFLTGISLQSIGSISIVYMKDIGLSAGFVATTATVSSLTLTCSKFLVGHIYDRKGLRFAILLCQFCAVSAFILKAILTNTAVGMVLAMVAVVLSSIAMPLETVMGSLLASDLFGNTSYAKVLGIFYAANSLGLCLGAPLCDFVREHIVNSYVPCFWFFAIIMVGVSIAFQFVINAGHKTKAKILAAAEAEVN